MRLAIQNTLRVKRLGTPSAERAADTSSAPTARALPCRPSMQFLIWLSGAPRGVPARAAAAAALLVTGLCCIINAQATVLTWRVAAAGAAESAGDCSSCCSPVLGIGCRQQHQLLAKRLNALQALPKQARQQRRAAERQRRQHGGRLVANGLQQPAGRMTTAVSAACKALAAVCHNSMQQVVTCGCC